MENKRLGLIIITPSNHEVDFWPSQENLQCFSNIEIEIRPSPRPCGIVSQAGEMSQFIHGKLPQRYYPMEHDSDHDSDSRTTL